MDGWIQLELCLRTLGTVQRVAYGVWRLVYGWVSSLPTGKVVPVEPPLSRVVLTRSNLAGLELPLIQ